MPAWNDASVRSDGFRNSSPSTLPASACGSGCCCSRCASASRSTISSRGKSARSRSGFMTSQSIRDSASRQAASTCTCSSTNGARMRTTCGSPLVPVRMSCASSSRCTSFAGRACAARAGILRPASPTTGPTMQVSRICAEQRRTFVEQVLALDDVDHRLDHRAGERAAAERRAQVVGLELRRDVIGDSSSAAHGKAGAQRLGGREHVGRDAVEIGGERLAGAAHAALHLVEDQQRAGLVAARAQRRRNWRAEVDRAARRPARARRSRPRYPSATMRAIAATSPRGTNSTSNGARGKPYHFWPRPTSRRRPRPCGRESCLRSRRSCGAPVDLERELERVLVGLGARVHEEHRVETAAPRTA